MKITYQSRHDFRGDLSISRRQKTEAELEPCPLCRDQEELDLLQSLVVCEASDLDDERAAGTWGVKCGNCGITLAGYDTPAEAIDRWNCREPGRGWR
jgi:hypothetical protein